MLYRTHHHPFLFPLIPFTSTPLSSHPHPASSSPFLSSSSESQVVELEMERVEGALRSSFRPDMALKTAPYHHQQQQALFDDLSTANGQNTVLGDDFFVDDLLDFSNAAVEDPEEQKQQEALKSDDITAAKAVSNVSSAAISVKDDDFGGSLPASELSVPAYDLESLEWLSHFVDDSFSEYSLTYPATKLPAEPAKPKAEPEVLTQSKPCFTTPVQTKARSKRARAGVPGWSFGSSSLSESSSSSTSSTSSTTTSSSPCNPWLFYSSPSQTQTAESLYGKPPLKTQKKRPTTESSGGVGGQQPRRCSHCGVHKTPQWRAGPLGAKTLCNACGVRYKSGRLLPEYRPACSPTFSSELHSNNHRKVLEMRRKKEMEDGLAPPVQSF